MVGTSPARTNQSRIGSGSFSVPSRRIQSRGPMPYTSAMDATAQPFIALAQVVMIDIALAGDNAIVVGLAASPVAANFIAKLLVRHAWIGWLGLAIVLYVALEMIWRGVFEVAAHA